MKKILQRGGASLKLTVQTANMAEEEEEEELSRLTSGGSSSTKNKHGWIIVEPRTLRANATAIKAAGIDWKTTRGMQMVGEWTALAAAKYRLAKSREVPELRAFAFVREVLVGEEGDEDGDEEVGYEERVRYGHGGVQLELFDDEDEIDDEIDTVLKNLSVDEEEMSNRASTSDEDDDDEEEEEEEGSEDEERDVIEKKHVTANRENAKPFSLRVRLASSGGVPVTFRLPNVFENSIFNVTSSYSNDEENKKKYKKSRNANRIGKGVDDAITFKFWANPSSLAEALSSPDALLKVHTSSSVSSVSMSGLLQKPTVKESLVIREEQEKVRLELTLSDLSSSFSSPHFVEEDEEQENFEPKPRPPLAGRNPKPTDFHDRIRRTRANILLQQQQYKNKQHRQSQPSQQQLQQPTLSTYSFPSEDDVRNTAEYNAAFALESWKRERMLAWESKFTEEATKRMQSLEEAWKQREIQRNKEFELSSRRAKDAENKLKELTRMLENREREVVRAEETIERRKKELERAHVSKTEQLKREYATKEETLEKKVENAIRDQKTSKKERDDATKKAAKLEKQKREIEDMFSEYKKSYFQSDVAKLNSEIATLRPRLESAESALEDASSSRDRFRVQMRKMAAQIVALEREKAQLRDALEKTGGVFPNRAHVAPDSSSLMMDVSSAFRGSESEYRGFGGGDDVGNISFAGKSKNTKKASSSISGGVDARLDALLASERMSSSTFKKDEDIEIPRANHHPMSMVEKRALEKEVRRLVNERGDLMRTGAYSSNDRAISLIDERIEELSMQISA